MSKYRWLSAPALLAIGIVGYGFAALVFVSLLVLTKKIFIGPIRLTGSHTLQERAVKKWFAAAMLGSIHVTGLFSSSTIGLSFLVPLYYRGMGAKIASSALLGRGAVIADPWFVEIGKNVSIGGQSLLLGHIGNGREILFGRVVIGDGSVIGAKAVLMPDVRVGKNAVVAAGAVVTRGTVVPDGEIWGGVPARKLSSKGRLA